MVKDEKYSCTSEFGAEVLMVIVTFVIAVLTMSGIDDPEDKLISEKLRVSLLSTGSAIILPLMSFIFGQAKLYYPEGRAQVILVWMVFLEIIRIHNRGYSNWSLQNAAEQLARLLWIGYLISGYASILGLKVSLIFLCAFFFGVEVLNGIIVNTAKNSYLIGKNPKLINNHMKRIMLQNDLKTTPMNICDYIVTGEKYHKITISDDGYSIGEKKHHSRGLLTIGRVFQLNATEDEAFTLLHPNWRDICLSLALAKMLRQRFARLPLYDDGSKKALNFVVEGLIDYFGCCNYDIQTEVSNERTNPIERVFSIIDNELKFVDSYLNIKIPAHHYYFGNLAVDIMAFASVFSIGIYLICTIFKSSSSWVSLVRQDVYYNCFFHLFRRGSLVVKVFSHFDQAITILLFIACLYVQLNEDPDSHPWSDLHYIEEYINNPIKWNESCNSLAVPSCILKVLPGIKEEKVKKTRTYSRLFKKDDSIFGIKLTQSTWNYHRKIPVLFRNAFESTYAKKAILDFLKNNGGQLTNGETSLRNHGMERFNWACRPSKRITEAILIWHIATILFEHQQPPPEQSNESNPESPSQGDKNSLSCQLPKQNSKNFTIWSLLLAIIKEIITTQFSSHPRMLLRENDHPVNKEREVALALSNYCHYLVKSFPELLPGEVEWVNEMYENVTKDIFAIDQSCNQKRSADSRCDYTLQTRSNENTVLGKGAKLANDLVACTAEGMQVWPMLADFWAEMILFIAPSDNVEGHEEILERSELITQIWALLSHAGIIKRREPIVHNGGENESREFTV